MPSLIWVNQFASLPTDGGGTRHFELGRELVRHGWKVTILASDLHLHTRRFTRRAGDTDRVAHLETLQDVDIRWLWAAPYQHNDWRRAWNWLSFYRSVVRELEHLTDHPDVVIGSSPQIFAASAARSLARKTGAAFVFEVRDLWPESLLAAGGRRGVAYALLDRVARGLYRDADRVLVLARGVGEYLVKRGVPADRVVHLPNGVDVGAIQPAVETEASRADGKRGPIRLIYAGAHGPANGLECVLDAAAALRREMDVRFVLVGDGPSKNALQRDAAARELSNIEFVATVGKPELLSLLQQADAGLMVLRDAPLFSFGVSPNKLFDYLAAGVPVISNVPGEVGGMLSRSGAGIQARDSSGGALAHAVRELVALGAAGRRHKGQLGRGWVEREHSRQVLGQRLDQALRDLIQ
jgi:glycosyltransferase involved in cell wall biosynthesis